MKTRKSGIVLVSAILLSVIALLASIQFYLSRASDLEGLRAAHGEMRGVAGEYRNLKLKTSSLEGRIGLTNVDGIATAVEEMLDGIGLKKSLKSLKPLDTKQAGDLSVEEAELQLEKMSMNEAVNVLYDIENSPMLMLIKKVDLRPSFDEPERLNVILTLSLARRK